MLIGVEWIKFKQRTPVVDLVIKTTFVSCLSRLSWKFKFGQKADIYSKCTNMKIPTQPDRVANC